MYRVRHLSTTRTTLSTSYNCQQNLVTAPTIMSRREILTVGSSWSLTEVSLQKAQPDDKDDDDDSKNGNQCYWLVRPLDDTNMPLQVQQGRSEVVPRNVAASQIFCLSHNNIKTPEAAVATASSITMTADHSHEATASVGTTCLYRDKWVNIWEFRLQPGQACPYHTHKNAYAFLNLTASVNQELDPRGMEVPNTLPSRQAAGQCTFVPRQKCGSHAIRNVGNDMFLQFIVEFLNEQNNEREVVQKYS